MQPFCLWANEIRYKYVYYRQKLGIYIYIRLSVYIKQGGGGCHYDDSTAPQAVVTTTKQHTCPQIAGIDQRTNRNYGLGEYLYNAYIFKWETYDFIQLTDFFNEMYEFRLTFHWSLFPSVQLTIFQHWFR